MSKHRSVVDVKELKNIVKRFEDDKDKRNKVIESRKITETIEQTKRLIEEIPKKLRRAAKNGEQSIIVLYSSIFLAAHLYYLASKMIVDFCDSNGLEHENIPGKDEKGNYCDVLYVNFR